MIDRWKKAVIHLECATDSEHFQDYVQRIQDFLGGMDAEKISSNEIRRHTGEKFRDLRFHGTAILLEHKKKRFLLSVRHVLWDKHVAKGQRPDMNRIFNIIFRVPQLDEVVNGSRTEPGSFLMNLGNDAVSYSFSDPDQDLAVISLDRRHRNFADELQALGFQPLSLSDFGEAPSAEGAEVMTVGYPSATALIGQLGVPKASRQWASNYFSLPTVSFGRVAMLHERLPYFWCDMSIYPGNSGGPVIEGGKVVGIVKDQAAIPLEMAGQGRLMSRIPFGKVIKASLLKELFLNHWEKEHG